MLIFKIFFTFLLFFPIICQTRKNDDVTAKVNVTTVDGQKNLTVLEKWERIEKFVKTSVKDYIKMALPMLMEYSGKVNLSQECFKSSLHLISGLKDLKPWAFEFLDSSGKFVDGLFTGSITSFGQYDQCLDIEVKSTKLRDNGKLLFGGQYCMIDMQPPLPPRPRVLKFKIPDIFQNFSKRDNIFGKALQYSNSMYDIGLRLGICIPSKCSKEDLSQMVNLLESELYLKTSVYRCEVKEENEFTPVAISVIAFYSLIFCLVLVATMIDAFAYFTDTIFKSKAVQVLLAFSFITNFKKFSSTDASRSNSLKCLNGVRFIGMIWVISLHTYIIFIDRNLHGSLSILDRIRTFEFQAVLNGSMSVDTFFFMGGLLVGYLTIKLCKDQKHKFNVVMFIIYRLLRILPTYVVIIMFSSLMHLLGSGPMWHTKANECYQACYKYWWTNLLFINNFYSMENMCFPTTWYIATDIQLYVFSLVIIIPLLRWPKIGICAGVLTILVSIAYAGVVTYIKEYPPAIVFYLYDKPAMMNYLANFNFKPFIHTGPYTIGILSGYLLAIKPKMKITPFLQVLGWSLAFIVSFTVIFGTADWYQKIEAPFVPAIIYASVKRTAWTFGVAWMIICCATGNGGFINYILSMNVFAPLSRLTFLAYLIHPIAQMITHGSFRTRVETSYYFTIYFVLGHICISYAVAFIVHMLVEVPFANLVRILLSRADKKEEHCNTGKENGFIKENNNAEQKENVIAITFPLDEKSNGIGNNLAVVTRNL